MRNLIGNRKIIDEKVTISRPTRYESLYRCNVEL